MVAIANTMLYHYLSRFLIHYQLSLDMCYLLGGYTEGFAPSKKVFSVFLDDLISQAVSQRANASAPPTPSPWQSLPDTPLIHNYIYNSLAFNGALLAVRGGYSGRIAINLAKGLDQGWGAAYQTIIILLSHKQVYLHSSPQWGLVCGWWWCW